MSKFLIPTAVSYLTLATEKSAEPIHPNLRAKLKANTLASKQRIKVACIEAVKASDNPQARVVFVLKQLKGETTDVVGYLKDLASDIAFAAHLDCKRIERLHNQVDSGSIDEGIDAMGEAHPFDLSDLSVFDVADSHTAPAREPYEGGEDAVAPIASSPDDVYEAVEQLQEWLFLGVSKFSPSNLEYWGLAGERFPLGQKKVSVDGEDTYVAITTMAEYIEHQDALWAVKRKAAPIDNAVEEMMMA